MDQILPKLNGKIKEIITVVDDGNVARFSKRLKNVSQQRLNRILNPDTRTGKYPGVPDDVLVSIATSMPNVNLDWLLADRGEMINNIQHLEGTDSSVAIGRDANGSKINIESKKTGNDIVKIVEKYQSQVDRLLSIIDRLTNK